MIFIPIGLHCSVPEGIRRANLREKAYPFDWSWCPANTTYNILNILINDNIDKCIEYMTNGYEYYKYLGNEHYIKIDYISECQMNKNTGLGITHYNINDEFKNKCKIRFERLLEDIVKNDAILIYADGPNKYLNYYLDEIEYGIDATDYLLKIYDLIYPINNNIKILYFCWNERVKTNNNKITYISFDFQENWSKVSDIIKDYLLNNYLLLEKK